jgi:glyoxylate utilization-related uncharacterized protein
MRTRALTDLVHFTEDAPRTEVLFETRTLWSQVICLQGSQGVGPLSDEEADGLVFVLSGEIAAQVGKSRARLKQWAAAPVPAGDALTVRNASPEPAVVLLVLAPPPAR